MAGQANQPNITTNCQLCGVISKDLPNKYLTTMATNDQTLERARPNLTGDDAISQCRNYQK